MSIGIQVAIRCRTFALPDKLGVRMIQHPPTSGGGGEVELLDSKYTRTRFPFTYAWWSAFGWERYQAEGAEEVSQSMTLVTQDDVYSSCGIEIKDHILDGCAVVLFACVVAVFGLCEGGLWGGKGGVPARRGAAPHPCVHGVDCLATVSVRSMVAILKSTNTPAAHIRHRLSL